MVDKQYLNWKNKIGYGSGDIAGNTVYAFLSTFLMFYLTDTVGMNVGIVGTLMAVSKLLDSVTDIFFGALIDRTHTKMGKARPWMLFGYIGCAVLLVFVFMIPDSWGDAAKYTYFFITYTLLNAVFYTANNIAYATLTALITKNTAERVQLGSLRYMFAFGTTMIIQTVTVDIVSAMGGDAASWKQVALIYAAIGLFANTISVLSFKEMPAEELYKTDFHETEVPKKSYTFLEGTRLLLANKYFLMVCGVYLLSQFCQSSLNMGVYFTKYVFGSERLLKTFLVCKCTTDCRSVHNALAGKKAPGNVQAEYRRLCPCVPGQAWCFDFCIHEQHPDDADIHRYRCSGHQSLAGRYECTGCILF